MSGILKSFLQEIDEQQNAAYAKLDLFDVSKTSKWTHKQKQYFVKVFYHTRGHFDRLLWTRLVYAPTAKAKQQILQYMGEEAGLPNLNSDKHLKAHELLFADFAESLHVDLTPELTEEESYLPFAKAFNNGLVKWFRSHDWESGSVGFSAYERLDNVDYNFMYKLAENIGISGKALAFFAAHRGADHFDKTSDGLSALWEKDESKVRAIFTAIYEHQLKMWQELSNAMFISK